MFKLRLLLLLVLLLDVDTAAERRIAPTVAPFKSAEQAFRNCFRIVRSPTVSAQSGGR